MLACAGFAEECVERIVATSDSFVTWHLSVRLDAMLQML